VPSYGAQALQYNTWPSVEFNPVKKQKFTIAFHLPKKSRPSIQIVTSDGEPVRIIKTPEPLPAGDRYLLWDGRDDAGIVVPNEAYIPILTTQTSDGESLVLDPRKNGGGEVVDNVNASVMVDRNIEYTLPAPSRVLIRVGIKNGPMLRSLANWLPKRSGRNIQRWDGYDQDYLMDLRTNKRLSVLVTAFKLPPNAIITYGNHTLTYRDYRISKGWTEKPLNPKQMILEKGGQRISRHYYYARTRDVDPQVDLSFKDTKTDTTGKMPLIDDQVKITINSPFLDGDVLISIRRHAMAIVHSITIGVATAAILSFPKSSSTSFRENSMAVPGPRLVTQFPSTTTRDVTADMLFNS
jgi:hypothetical protein